MMQAQAAFISQVSTVVPHSDAHLVPTNLCTNIVRMRS